MGHINYVERIKSAKGKGVVMATYSQIQAYVTDQFGFKPKSCWIAHVKEIVG